jgi:SAM-dependent methyltransferase
VSVVESLAAEFDADFYRRTYPDLQAFNDAELEGHYRDFGIKEGRSGSRAAARKGFLSLIAKADSILEIGPMAAPVVRGGRVKYFDVLATDALKAKATRHGMNANNCPHIDYVSETGDLSVIDAQFDAVVSSHAVEHQPDLVAHLKHVARILKPEGRYFLLVPDKRYCFDHFIPESSIAEIIDAHIRKKRFHDVSSIIEHLALTTHNDPARHWKGDHGEPHFRNSPQRVRDAMELFHSHENVYLDTHAWQFTPATFRENTALLFELGIVPLKPVRVYETVFDAFEFCAVLEKSEMPKAAIERTVPDDFDAELYLLANPDVRAAGVDARMHFIQYGRREGRKLRPKDK